MSAERGPLTVPSDTSRNQALASDPLNSVWVEANAGSGKTFVLTNRVLRLLLAGVTPQSILCLTYTKAAAAEMRKRVGARLAEWALAPEAELVEAIAGLTDSLPTPKMLRDARTLFARALETPGGLRILTIHAFCEAVLHRFPIEAGVPFDFAVIEDDRQAQLMQTARESVLAEGLRGTANVGAVETLFGLLSDHAIGEAIAAALGEGPRLKPVLADIDGAKARLRRLVGLAAVKSGDLFARVVSHSLLTPDLLVAIRTKFGPPSGKTGCLDVLAGIDPHAPDADTLRTAFFTQKGEPRARLMTKAERDLAPEIEQILSDEQQRLVLLDLEIKAALLAERSEALLDVIAAIRTRYEAEKRRHSLLDFDDLIEKLGDLFADKDLGPWVRYKLDAGIDHVLVDESQDTNAQQWRVVNALADEFFTGEGAVERPRSIFAVGDQKQSIYSFQGAQPALFGETGREMGRRAGQADKAFKSVRLHTSFRTLPGILGAVDRVMERPDIQAALLAGEKVLHAAARSQPGGSVILWPPIQEEKTERDIARWPLEPVETGQSAARQLATRIAEEIKGWIGTGRVLAGRNRAVHADDVLILVQKRGVYFQEIIRALRQNGLPTPGADRLAVTGHIAVLDLLALVDVLLNPADDLQLAALLRSPLFDVSEDDLFTLANGRSRKSLWSTLHASGLPGAMAASAQLDAWRRRLDSERPYEFLSGVLYADGGLRRFHARLGQEIDEVLSELLELALAHEQGEQPSLQGFAVDMRRRSIHIKRELAESGGGVRVMTVHGAKGLEAPIVILADAASKPVSKQTEKPVYIVGDDPGPLLIHAGARSQHVPATLAHKQAADAILAQEYWRRLYVGMTRAEDELYVTGILGSSGKIEGSWYEAVEMALEPDLVDIEDQTGAIRARCCPPLPGTATVAGRPVPEAPVADEAPPAPVPERPSVPVMSPSSIHRPVPGTNGLETLAERTRDADLARREGLAVHALLEHLGKVDPDLWTNVAPRALETLLPEAPDRHQPVARRAISILTRPEHAALFGPSSRAEVPFRVTVLREGQPMVLSGRMDRVVVDAEGVLVVDFKSDAAPPMEAAAVKGNYLTQLALYALVAGQLFPGQNVRAAILWTELESLMNLPIELLDSARSGFTMR
ncbi:MAG: double-strand break repair helicase AddA [Devosia sp.]|uniref:double-strand break repair helicase AddA n=1 Tax=Devosia sp. TaxID=1871048 RepID=UPI0024C88103|nr:double-strand break repair helicase AddA [Devosia sp.]UYN98844.1 MAG: double-strand break repair helicase AddA [Devosia sp.]